MENGSKARGWTWGLLVVAVALAGAGCGGDEGGARATAEPAAGALAPTPPPASPASPAPGVTAPGVAAPAIAPAAVAPGTAAGSVPAPRGSTASPAATPGAGQPVATAPAPAAVAPAAAIAQAPAATPPPAPSVEARPQAPAQAAPRPQIPLHELLAKRDLWPEKVALVEPLTIERGVTLPAGHELVLHAFDASDAVLDSGTDFFAVSVAQTDALERAYATRAALTDEQRALDANALLQRPELWPTTVRTTRRLAFQGGRELPVGTEASLRAVTPGGWVSLYAEAFGDHFPAEAFECDVVARARERLVLPESERTPFFVRSLAAALEPESGAAELERAEYLLVYRARLGCGRCAGFAPELAAAYQRLKATDAGGRFEAVFWSEDKTAEDMRSVRAAEHLPGRAVRFDRRLAAADIATQHGSGLLPLVTLYDRTGKRVAQNHPQGGKPSAADVLATLEAKLGEGR